MQVAIDNAKRKFDVELDVEIPRIKKELNIEENGLPSFWLITKKDKRKAKSDKERKERQQANKNKIKEKINKDLICPMNYLYDLKLKYERDNKTTLPMSCFFIKHDLNENRRKSKKVEELIQNYSFNLHKFYVNHDGVNWEDDKDEVLLLNSEFDKLISDIRSLYISKNYLGLMSWLINRAFCISSGAKSKSDVIDSNLDKNKSLFMKVLYNVNKDAFLACFKDFLHNDDFSMCEKPL